jgi:membrane-associated phospholipid phosphatase
MTNGTRTVPGVGTAVVLCLGFLAGSVALGWLAYGFGPLERLDMQALARTAANRESSLEPLANFCVHLADPAPVVGLTILCCLLGLASGRLREAAAAVALVTGASLTALILKSLLEHSRFDAELGPHQIAATAYPSGHSTAAMAVALAFVLVAPPAWRPIVGAVLALYAFAVGAFLLFLGDHFPSDILGGWMIAAAWFFAALAGLRASLLLGADRVAGKLSPPAAP